MKIAIRAFFNKLFLFLIYLSNFGYYGEKWPGDAPEKIAMKKLDIPQLTEKLALNGLQTGG
jgi:hypothetical protein